MPAFSIPKKPPVKNRSHPRPLPRYPPVVAPPPYPPSSSCLWPSCSTLPWRLRQLIRHYQAAPSRLLYHSCRCCFPLSIRHYQAAPARLLSPLPWPLPLLPPSYIFSAVRSGPIGGGSWFPSATRALSLRSFSRLSSVLLAGPKEPKGQGRVKIQVGGQASPRGAAGTRPTGSDTPQPPRAPDAAPSRFSQCAPHPDCTAPPIHLLKLQCLTFLISHSIYHLFNISFNISLSISPSR